MEGNNMETIYDNPILTLIFISAIGFWYAVGKTADK